MIDHMELEKALRAMKPRSKLYELVKKEMKLRGRWKAKARGKAFSKGYDERRRS